MSQLTLVAEAPSINGAVLSDYAREVISTTNINNLLSKLELFRHVQILKTANAKLAEGICSPNIHFALIIQS